MAPSAALFLSFCALIALRDVLSEWATLRDPSLTPHLMILVYYAATLVLSATLRLLTTLVGRSKRANESEERARKAARDMGERAARRRTARVVWLGLTTWIVYVATFVALPKLTAPVFNTMDYSLAPLFVVGIAAYEGSYVTRRQMVGFAIGGLGLIFLALGSTTPAPVLKWGTIWASLMGLSYFALGLLSPLFTAISTDIQAKLVREDAMPPLDVLLARFTLPTVLTLSWVLWDPPPGIMGSTWVILILVSVATVFLPLYLLCFAFMTVTLKGFAPYLLVIPVLTILLYPLIMPLPKWWALITSWKVALGVAATLLGWFLTIGRSPPTPAGSPAPDADSPTGTSSTPLPDPALSRKVG